MSKNESTRQILNNGNCWVKDNQKEWGQNLPSWMNLSNSELDNFDSLVEALGKDRAHALIHKGLVQSVIDVRAQARYKNKNGEYTGKPESYEPSLLPDPSKKKTSTKSLPEQIADFAKDRYGKEPGELTKTEKVEMMEALGLA